MGEEESERIDKMKKGPEKERAMKEYMEKVDIDVESHSTFPVSITTVQAGMVTMILKEGVADWGKIIVETHNGDHFTKCSFDMSEFKLLYLAMIKHGAKSWEIPPS